MNSFPAPATHERPLFTRRFWFIVATQGTYAFSWSVFLLMPTFITEQLHGTPAQVGAVGAFSNLAAVACIPLLGRLLDRVGRRPLFTVGALMCAAQAFGVLWVDHVGVALFGLQMAWGLSFIIVFNAGGALVADGAPTERLGQALGIFGAANIVMNAVASATTEAVADAHSWSAGFTLAGIVALAAAVLSRWLPETVESSGGSTARPPVVDRRLLRVVGGAIAMGFGFSAVFTFYQPYVLAQGVDDVSRFFLGFTLAAVAVRLTLGRVPDRFGRQRVAAFTMASYGVITASFMFVSGPTLPLFGALFGAAHGMLHPAMAALAVEHRPSSARGTALAYANGGFMLGTSLGSAALGQIATHLGFAPLFVVAGAVVMLGVAFLRASASQPVSPSGPSGLSGGGAPVEEPLPPSSMSSSPQIASMAKSP